MWCFHKVRISELWREGNWPSAVVCCRYRGRGGYIGPWWPPFFNISKRAGRDAGYEIERRENGRAIRKVVWQKAQTTAFRLFSSREFFLYLSRMKNICFCVAPFWLCYPNFSLGSWDRVNLLFITPYQVSVALIDNMLTLFFHKTAAKATVPLTIDMSISLIFLICKKLLSGSQSNRHTNAYVTPSTTVTYPCV